MSKNRFIVLEGLDGSGKSTQAHLLADVLKDLNIRHYHVYQPSSDSLGKEIREILHGGYSLENETIALLFAADRYQHYHDKILPELEAGGYVICDRYYYSNMAYQGADAAALERIIAYNQAVMTTRPDIVFFIDVPPEECMRRITSSRTEISIYESLERLKLQRERYFAAFERLKPADNIIVIDAADKSPRDITSQICAHLNLGEMP